MNRGVENLFVFMWVTLLSPGLVLGDDHPCQRPCHLDPTSRKCYYHFVLEEYITMSKACYSCPLVVSDCHRPDCIPGDGSQVPVFTANRQLPGPSIQVCKGDEIIVNVSNRFSTMSTAIHWHGIHQKETPYMDGVPMITQCPIPPQTTFQYRFKTSYSGTFMWHGHSGLQKASGLSGPLIVRDQNDSQSHLYDYDLQEHTILLSDWIPRSFKYQFLMRSHGDGDNKPSCILVNGRGTCKGLLDRRANKTVYVPHEVFTVEPGHRYRFRLISSGVLNCPIQLSVDDHQLMVIATDGFPVQETWTDSLVIYSGERFDFVLLAGQRVANFWIKLRGLLDGDQRFNGVYQGAILRYAGASLEDPPGDLSYQSAERSGKMLNPLNSVSTPSLMDVHLLNSTLPDDEALKPTPDFKYFITFDYRYVVNPFVSDRYYNRSWPIPLFNDIAFSTPPSPLLTQWETVPKDMICNSSVLSNKNCSREFCSCIHILKFPIKSVVELIFVDEGVIYTANHPLHLHGYHFRVVAMDKLGESTSLQEVQHLDDQNKIPRKLQNSVLKDTVTVPDGGFTIVRFYADNPGFWLLHCHLDFHMEEGMELVIQVGDVEDMKLPPKSFPTCGDWKPPPSTDSEY